MEKQRQLWASGIRANKEAKKLAFAHVEETFDSLVEEALNSKRDFVYEGHFTNDATWEIPARFKSYDYQIHLIFFGLTDIHLSELRVVERTNEGGHYVDPFTISANFYGNLEKLDKFYKMFDSVQIVDTSETTHKVLCEVKEGAVISSVSFNDLPKWFNDGLHEITADIRTADSAGGLFKSTLLN